MRNTADLPNAAPGGSSTFSYNLCDSSIDNEQANSAAPQTTQRQICTTLALTQVSKVAPCFTSGRRPLLDSNQMHRAEALTSERSGSPHSHRCQGRTPALPSSGCSSLAPPPAPSGCHEGSAWQGRVPAGQRPQLQMDCRPGPHRPMRAPADSTAERERRWLSGGVTWRDSASAPLGLCCPGCCVTTQQLVGSA